MSHDILGLARQTVSIEIAALERLSARLDARFESAVRQIEACRGRVIVIGMGKSGIIGRKMAATFASTGTPSFFVHPGEAFHGDLGMVKPIDIALMISNSGETEEVIRLLPFLQHQGNVCIAMTGNPESTLARHADVVLDISVEREACNNNLAPTSSTTATLVMGDALAVVLSTLRGFQPEDFARFHPGGRLGRRLLTRVRDVMHTQNLPLVGPATPFREVVQTMSRGRLGMAVVVTDGRAGEALQGVITDGDLRRTLEAQPDLATLRAADMMTATPKVIGPEALLAEAEDQMLERNIQNLVVVDAQRVPLGVLQIYDK